MNCEQPRALVPPDSRATERPGVSPKLLRPPPDSILRAGRPTAAEATIADARRRAAPLRPSRSAASARMPPSPWLKGAVPAPLALALHQWRNACRHAALANDHKELVDHADEPLRSDRLGRHSSWDAPPPRVATGLGMRGHSLSAVAQSVGTRALGASGLRARCPTQAYALQGAWGSRGRACGNDRSCPSVSTLPTRGPNRPSLRPTDGSYMRNHNLSVDQI